MAVLRVCSEYLPLKQPFLHPFISRFWCFRFFLAWWVHSLTFQLLQTCIIKTTGLSPVPRCSQIEMQMRMRIRHQEKMNGSHSWRFVECLCQLRGKMVTDISWGLEVSLGLRMWRQCNCPLPNPVARSLLLYCQLDQKIIKLIKSAWTSDPCLFPESRQLKTAV